MPHPLLLAVVGSAAMLAACVPKTAVPAPQDKTAPVLAEVTPVPNGVFGDYSPSYTFSSTEAGTITYGGSCSSATTSASSGNNTITFTSLGVGFYQNCTIKVVDAKGNSSAILAVNSFLVGKPYNDTGITTCGDMAYSYDTYTGSNSHNNTVDCVNGASPSSTATQQGFEIANGLDAVPAGQDAHFGRDANPATNSDADGHKGFSFTKLSAIDGTPLAIQSGTWSDAGSEAAGTQWGCVQDNVTGLVWEIKTNDGGLRDKDWKYTWYNTDSTNNGGSAGLQDTGVGVGSDACFNNARCDTGKYLADVNAENICGETANDWRLPNKEELRTLRQLTKINTIDHNFIPNTAYSGYWSASPYAENNGNVWYVSFNYGYEHADAAKSSGYFLRLVRGGQ